MDFYELPYIPMAFLGIPMEFSWITVELLWIPVEYTDTRLHQLALAISSSATQDEEASTCNANHPVHVTGSGLVPDWWERRHMEESDQEAGRRI